MANGAAALADSGLGVEWHQTDDGHWRSLMNLDLRDPDLDDEGVYVIWHGGQEPAVVYVGSGNIAERLRAHLSEGRIMLYAGLGLGVTWAAVPSEQQRGVERFLVEQLDPAAGGRYPNDEPVTVNLPW